MKLISTCSLFFLSLLSFSQSDLVFPWVTNNATFQATLIINNLGSELAELQLVANRAEGADGVATEALTLMLGPLEQRVFSAAELFPLMGAGPGYSVRVESSASNITGALVVNATGTVSGASPSQADVVETSQASRFLAFNFLPLDSGISAPVVYNAGNANAEIIYHAYQNGQDVATVFRTIPPGKPLAETTESLFPQLSGSLFVVATSEQPLLGLAFLFNDSLEPSMATAKSLTFLPQLSASETISFSAQILPIFQQSCSDGDCHIGFDAGGLALDESVAYANIVNVPSLQNFQMPLITPKNPDQSYLFQKLLPDGNYFNDRMPKNRAPLAEGNISLIRTWILEGAREN